MTYFARVFEDLKCEGAPGKLILKMDITAGEHGPDFSAPSRKLCKPIGFVFGTYLEIWMVSEIVAVLIFPTLNRDDLERAINKYRAEGEPYETVPVL